MKRYFALFIVISLILNVALIRDRSQLIEEKDKYKENTETLLNSVNKYKLDSAKNAIESSRLQMTLKEYKQYREDDLATIKKLGIDIKKLKIASQQNVVTKVPINIPVRDSIVYRDSIIKIPSIKLSNKYIHVDAMVENDSLKGTLQLNTKLKQYVYTIPKHKFLWWKWGVRGIKQVIISDNPYVQIEYSEFITINK